MVNLLASVYSRSGDVNFSNYISKPTPMSTQHLLRDQYLGKCKQHPGLNNVNDYTYGTGFELTRFVFGIVEPLRLLLKKRVIIWKTVPPADRCRY